MAGLVTILLTGLNQAFIWSHYHQSEAHCLENRLQILTKSMDFYHCEESPRLPFTSEESKV